jgi:DNA repair protein RadD
MYNNMRDILMRLDIELLKSFFNEEINLFFLDNVFKKEDLIETLINKNIDIFLDDKVIDKIEKNFNSNINPTYIIDFRSHIKSLVNTTNSDNVDSIFKPKYKFIKEGNRFFELLDYQYIIKNQVVDVLSNDSELLRMILHMPTGTGKTKTATHIVIHHYLFNIKKKGIIIWLAHTNELLQQAYNSFESNWSVLGDNELNVSYNNIDSLYCDNSILFLSYQKLISIYKKNKKEFEVLSKYASAIIADEAHKCLATETSEAIEELFIKKENYNNKFLLGLTATPGRKFEESLNSGENLALALMFDRRIFTIRLDLIEQIGISEEDYGHIENNDNKVIHYFQSKRILSNIKRKEINYSINNEKIIKLSKKHTEFSSKDLSVFAADYSRNVAIVDQLIELENSNTSTIVFACSVEHGKTLETILNLRGIVSHGIYGETLKSKRELYLKEFNQGKFNILINFDVLSTGFDSTKLECVFITRPTNSIVLYSQMLGRGLRGPKMGGTEECLLIDIKDNLQKYDDENKAFQYFDAFWKENS